MLYRCQSKPHAVEDGKKFANTLKLYSYYAGPSAPAKAPTPAAAPKQVAPTLAKAPVHQKPVAVKTLHAVADRVEQVKGIRKAMAKTMAQSLAIPHFGYCDEINVTRLIELRPILKPLADQIGVRLSYMPFFMKVGAPYCHAYSLQPVQFFFFLLHCHYTYYHHTKCS